ncbi:HNH endonuclease signature motif containing protein [Acetobacter thailandicus]|uniref:HNH endonuclease signature motif containing protein n=1 Tax=Acetobacter thailandicus TaxID=1502842 RepID=UPI001BAAF7D2|nr:HNH endonuclease signature motif containing protein [Acetobacter thailandicus]MBS0985773.1 HNH endonuclease [Acetobacter thailandicus]
MTEAQTQPQKTNKEKRQELERFLSVPENHEATQRRLLSKINKNGTIPQRNPELGPCWLWTGATTGHKPQYGKLHISAIKQQPRAHVVAYLLKHGVTPEDKTDIDHLCGNTLCVNHNHLEAVTHHENMLRVRKGWKKPPIDEASRTTRFFDAVAHEIRKSSILEIQEKTGLSHPTVSKNRAAVRSDPFIGPLVIETEKQLEQATADHEQHARAVAAWKADPVPQLERRAKHLNQESQQLPSSDR